MIPREQLDQVLLDLHGVSLFGEAESTRDPRHVGVDDDALVPIERVANIPEVLQIGKGIAFIVPAYP